MTCCSAISRKLSTARRLSPDDLRQVLRAWALLLLVDLGLRLLPFQCLVKLIGKAKDHPGRRLACTHAPASRHTEPELVTTLRRLQGLLDVACRNHLYPMTCLRRALVLQVLLKEWGISTELQLGVRKQEERFEAHAWLEYEGRPIAEPEAIRTHFRPMAGINTSGSSCS
jgi:hypothetical protein